MSLTIREQIHAKLAETLATELADLFDGIRVERNRDSEVQVFPSVIVIDGSQQRFEPESKGFNEYHVTPSIEGYVQHQDQEELGPLLNELYGQVIKAVMKDRSLGGLAIDTAEGFLEVSIGRRKNQQPTAGFAVDLTVKFWTAEDDPFEPGPG